MARSVNLHHSGHCENFWSSASKMIHRRSQTKPPECLRLDEPIGWHGGHGVERRRRNPEIQHQSHGPCMEACACRDRGAWRMLRIDSATAAVAPDCARTASSAASSPHGSRCSAVWPRTALRASAGASSALSRACRSPRMNPNPPPSCARSAPRR